MKNQGRVISGFILVFLVVIFSVLNIRDVPVSFGFFQFEWPLILIILTSVVIGAIIVLLVSSTTILKQNKKVKELKKNVNNADNEIEDKISDQLHEQKKKFEQELDFVKQSYEEQLTERDEQINQLKQGQSADNE